MKPKTDNSDPAVTERSMKALVAIIAQLEPLSEVERERVMLAACAYANAKPGEPDEFAKFRREVRGRMARTRGNEE